MVPTHFHGIFALEERFLAEYRDHGLKKIISNAVPGYAVQDQVRHPVAETWVSSSSGKIATILTS